MATATAWQCQESTSLDAMRAHNCPRCHGWTGTGPLSLCPVAFALEDGDQPSSTELDEHCLGLVENR
jgi:hypothetical protein